MLNSPIGGYLTASMRSFSRSIGGAIVGALCLLVSAPLRATEYHGIVKFGGLPLPGANLTATQGEKKYIATTGLDGSYLFPDLPDGDWTVRVEMLCFATVTKEITVAPGVPTAEWELKMLPMEEIRAAAAAAAPTVSAPFTDGPVLTTSVPLPAASDTPQKTTRRKGKNVPAAPGPVNTASAFQRTDVNASATPAPYSADSGPANPPSGDLNQSAIDSLAINGSVNNGASSPFATAQAFGNSRRGPGSLYNGNIGLILDNAALDARSYSLTGQDTLKPAYNHIQGMAAVGGPLRIPHLLHANNAPNFFLAYQIVRNRNATTQSALMPTAAERAGDFSQTSMAQAVLDPTTGSPFPGSVIPQSRISPQAVSLLRFYPLPNFNARARYNYQIPVIGRNDQDSIQSRITKSIDRSNQVFGTFAYQNTRNLTNNIFGLTDHTSIGGISTTLNWSHRFTQRLFTTVTFGFNRQSTDVLPYFANKENVSGEAGITGNNQDPLYWGPPALAFASGIAGLSDAQTSSNHNQTTSVGNNTFWGHAPHNFTFGADFRRQRFNSLFQQDPRGSFTFTGAAAGSDFAGFLLGVPDTISIAFGNADKYFRSSIYDAYFTDDWRLSPGFTLNAGVRWEYNAPITELYGRLVNLDIAPGFTAVAPVIADRPIGSLTGIHYPDSLVQPDKHGFEPRIGIAWRPISGSSMVVRAGYGVTCNTSIYQTIAIQMAQQSPLSKSLSVQNSAGNPLTLANGFIGSLTTTANTFAIDPNFRVGYAQSWQLSMQRDLPGALVLNASYLGIKGTRAVQEFLPNTYPEGAVNPCPACPAGYAYLTSNGNSTRNAGNIQLRRRLHNGMTATLQYTYSKAIDDAALGGKGQGTPVIAQDWRNLSGERGLSTFDQRHLLSFQGQYTTGVGVGGGTLLDGWRGTLFKEWTISTQITAGTGFPLTPIYLTAVNGTGVTGTIRPDYTGAPLYAAPSGFFLNPAAYRVPAPGQWGSAGRNSITGPDQFTLNASLARTFRLRDRLNMDVRIDSMNTLNHVTYQSWVTTVTSAQFGLPTQANAMRSVQASMRVRF